ncbi:hypothetical protein BCR44DRAFT_243898 [Catenaria anguillulae PL171]|uniref:Uncharacterized protein n=1 Tax=Catenaria anguillulae PL171 TaxID=765915 RepID=A0A1Y2H3Z5_9FUNG|nr:hypothetical protein BCR44DRAFT_243898 [Catenaria anguillulae PL171]
MALTSSEEDDTTPTNARVSGMLLAPATAHWALETVAVGSWTHPCPERLEEQTQARVVYQAPLQQQSLSVPYWEAGQPVSLRHAPGQSVGITLPRGPTSLVAWTRLVVCYQRLPVAGWRECVIRGHAGWSLAVECGSCTASTSWVRVEATDHKLYVPGFATRMDTWGLGANLFFMVFGWNPFCSIDQQSALEKFVEEKRRSWAGRLVASGIAGDCAKVDVEAVVALVSDSAMVTARAALHAQTVEARSTPIAPRQPTANHGQDIFAHGKEARANVQVGNKTVKGDAAALVDPNEQVMYQLGGQPSSAVLSLPTIRAR